MALRPFLPAYIFRTYAASPLMTRLFILIRSRVCPFQSIIEILGSAGPVRSLLDIGCGHGLFLHLVQLWFPGIEGYGVDHDPHKIAVARKSRGRGRAVFLDGNDGLDQLPPAVDCVSLIDVLYSIPAGQWARLFDLARARLAPTGLLIVKETVNRPRWKYYFCLVQEILAIRILKYTKGHFPHLPSVQDYLTQLSANGFELISHRRLDRGYPWPHYLFVARKKGPARNMRR